MLGTIENNSKMFFAYNNGLTITADDVVVNNGLLHSITNIQVVNGGQTSNTLLYAKKSKNLDLQDTFLQAKISIINKEKYDKNCSTYLKVFQYSKYCQKIRFFFIASISHKNA